MKPGRNSPASRYIYAQHFYYYVHAADVKLQRWRRRRGAFAGQTHMQFTSHLFSFVVFIVAYVLWLVLNFALFQLLRNATNSQLKTLAIQEAMLIVSYGGFFLFVYLLSGFLVWPLVAAFLIVGQLGFCVTLLFYALFASVPHVLQRATWAGLDFILKYKVIFFGAQALAIVAIVAYPVAAGIVYFGQSNSDEMMLKSLKFTIAFIIFLNFTLYPSAIGIGASKNIDERMRLRFLINQFGGLIPNAILLALLFMTFSGNISELSVRIGKAVPEALWFQVMIVLFVFFVVTTILPYLVGAHRGAGWRNEMLERRLKWCTRLEEALSVPHSASYLQTLHAVRDELTQAESALLDDLAVAIGDEIDRGRVDDYEPPLVEAYRKAREYDPRFAHLDALREIRGRIDKIVVELEAKQAEPDKIAYAAHWANYFQRRAVALTDLQTQEKSTSPVSKLAFPAITIVISGILSGASKSLWERILENVFFP